MKLRSLFLLAFSVVFAGCSATNTVTMSIKDPAPVMLPPHMERVGVMNRAHLSDRSGVLGTVDQLFSMKGPAFDSTGAAAALEGLLEELSRDDRFAVLVEADPTGVEKTASGVFPAQMDWDDVDAICYELGLGGLFILEWYDTRMDVEYRTVPVTREGPLGVEVKLVEHQAVVTTDVRSGWRIYDNRDRLVIDETVKSQPVVTTGQGINPTRAIEAVTGRTEAVQSVSRELGRSYAQRVLPYWIRVTRDYYVRGTNDFKTAKRRAQTGNWEGAAEIWLAQTGNPDRKIAGRAAYNMAIISEIRGDLDAAIGWSRAAYEDYGDKRALTYSRLLQDRQDRLAFAEME